ncbi:amidoligase family protein [Aliidiomarina celeris]|uniref:amidoligase family protein n=1 Tax=Aliidiomarina celeris TaxID=2249428 RepID=UPI0013007A3F|nr:amidoligase family protein [Aliidiomarina celeris]
MAVLRNFPSPNTTGTPSNEPSRLRKVGVEIEFGGLSLHTAQRVLKAWLEGIHASIRVKQKGRYEYGFSGDPAGDWVIELDFALLKQMGRTNNDNRLLEAAEKSLAWLSEGVVPIEVVSPPLPLSALPPLEVLIQQLREAGAEGSSKKLTYAFGLQLNPELPALTASFITRYLKSFLCLYEWLLSRINPDISRRMSTYIEPFPDNYQALVLSSDYAPNMTELIDDYLAHNPTRNRPLDLLPLFMHVDEKRLRAVVSDPLVKPRPTFHYRMPSCEIDQPDWGFHSVWNDWVLLELLAEHPELLSEACALVTTNPHSALAPLERVIIEPLKTHLAALDPL